MNIGALLWLTCILNGSSVLLNDVKELAVQQKISQIINNLGLFSFQLIDALCINIFASFKHVIKHVIKIFNNDSLKKSILFYSVITFFTHVQLVW